MNYELLADEILVRLLKESDVRAFDAVFNRYWKRIFFSAYKKLGAKEIAEDLTQNLFAKLWDKRRVQNIDHLYRYLSIGIKNSVINHVNAELVKLKHRKTITGQEAEVTADTQVVLKDLQKAIQAAIGQLPEKTRIIFQLSKFQSHSVKEIACKVGLTEKAVEYHITQSNKLVRLYLKDFVAFLWVLAFVIDHNL